MYRLYTAANLQDAYLMLHRLERAGIAARVLNEHAQGGLGELPFTHVYPEVWLDEASDIERARAIVAEHERKDDSAGERPCPSCKEHNPGSFEVCWRCGAALER